MTKTIEWISVLGLVGCGQVAAHLDAGNGSGSGSDGPPSSGQPMLAVSPMTHEFGPVALSATSAAATFTFTNTGDGPATGCSAPAKAGTNPDDFTIAADGCGTSDLAAGGSCTVMVTAHPSLKGIRTMTLSRTCTTGGTAMTTDNAVVVNRPMYIFITQASYNGNLGGIAGADGLCQLAGTSGSLTAPLNKTWKALLSKGTGGTINAKERFVWTGPMLDLTGKTVTQDPSTWPWVNAGEGSIIGVNQNGGGPGNSYVWSGSTINGLSKGATQDCNGWTSDTQSYSGWSGETSTFPNNTWFDSFGTLCADMFYGLYCVSQ